MNSTFTLQVIPSSIKHKVFEETSGIAGCCMSIKPRLTKSKIGCKLFLILFIQLFVIQASAQVVTVTGNAAGTYGSLAAAFTALPATLTANTVVTLNAGNPQTAPVGGYSITTTGTASFSLTINGSNNTITAPAQTAASVTDAIFKIIGGDYITIQGFTMQERVFTPVSADLTAGTNTMTEWGVALLSSSTTNGAQNNTIRNNTISLNRSYSNTFGIYSNTTHIATNVTSAQTPSGASGTNSNNRVYANSISNVNYGIVFISPATFATITFMDTGNDIGGASLSTGNTISNCGGVVSATAFNERLSVPYCIHMRGQTQFNLSYNSITSASFSSTYAFGIYLTGTSANTTNTYTQNITNNTLTMTMTGVAAQFDAFTGIMHSNLQGTLPNVTVNITNNTLLNCTSASNFYGIATSSCRAGTLNINGNIMRGTTLSGTSGELVGVYCNTDATSGALTYNVNNNQFGTAASNFVTFSAASSGTVRCVNIDRIPTTGSVNIQNNDVQGFVHTVAGTASHTYFRVGETSATPLNLNVSGNTFTNLSVNTTGSITFFSAGYLMPVNGTQVYNNNSIVGNFTKAGASGNVTIFSHFPVTPRAANQVGSFTYTNNNFRNIVCSGTSTIAGISNTDRGSKIINNNTFRNWQAPTGITCINVSGFLGTANTSNTISSNTLDSLASNAFTSIILGQTALTPNTEVLSVENNTISRIFTSGNFTGFSSSARFNTLNINNNSISGVQLSGTTSAFTGISSTGIVSDFLNINNNQFGNATTNLVTFSAASSGSVNCVTISGNAPLSNYTIQNNDVRRIVHSTAGSGAHTYYSFATPLNLNVIGNTFTNLSVNTSGAITFFSTAYNMPQWGAQIFTNNSIVGGFTKSAANGNITIFSHTGTNSLQAGIDHSYNNFRNIVCSGTSSITGITNADIGTKQIFNNTFRNWQAGSGVITGITLAQPGSSSVNNINENNIDSLATSGNITGIFLGNTGSNPGPINVTNNAIGRLFTSGSGTVTGISNTYNQASTVNINNNSIGPISAAGISATGISVSAASANHNIFANKIFDLSSSSTSATSVVTGILASNGSTNNIYNNRIGNLGASASTNANAVIGLNLSGGTTANVYYNTIYLNNLTGGATFGASGIFAAIAPALTLNNNLVRVTGTAAGTNGRIAAYRRVSGTASVIPLTYSTSSNNNMFYAGTPNSTNLIFVEGLTNASFTNPHQNLTNYKSFMSTRDQASTTAASASVPSFLSTTGSSADFLKLNQTNVTDVADVGATISGYSVDFEADTRNNPPDIGADEICVSPGVPTGLTSQTRCGGNGTVTFTVADPGVGNTIEWSNNGVTTNGSTGLNYSPSIIVESPINVYARAVNTASGCRSAWTSVVYGTAYYSPTATAGAALSAICQGATSSAMGGSVGGGATGGTWSGGAGTWTNANNPIAATYTAGASESGSITLTLTTSGGSCGTTTAAKTITVNLSPTATAGSALSICQGASSSAMGGSVGGGATGGTWTGGVGTWTSATNPSTATYLASASESGSITLTLTTSGGSCGTTTTTKTITVNATTALTSQPTAPAAICEGSGTQTVSVSAIGGALSYSWRRNGAALSNGGVISGQGTNTLTLTNPLTANAGNYDVIVTGSCGSPITSSAVSVVVNAAPSVSVQPSVLNVSYMLNQAASNLSVTATAGSGTITGYQWWSNTTATTAGATLLTGATGSIYTPSTASIGTLYYFCVITNSNGCSVNSAISGAITVYPIPNISAVTGTTPLVSGQSPFTGYRGQTLTITGSNFASNATISINGVNATVTFVNSTQLTAVVNNTGANVASTIVVTNPTGGAFSSQSFSFSGYITNTASDWATPSAWLGGSLPLNNATATIAHATSCSTNVAAAMSEIIIRPTATLTLSGASAQLASAAVSLNGTLAFSGTGLLDISSAFTLGGSSIFTCGTGTVRYSGSADQTLFSGPASLTYNILTLAGSGNKSLSASTDLTALNVVVNAGSTLRMQDSNNDVFLNGDFSVNGSLNAEAGTIHFTGTSDQNIAFAGAGPLTFNNLRNAKTAGVLRLNGNIKVNNSLSLEQGNINTLGNILELGKDLTQTGSLNYTAGMVHGIMRRWFAAGTNSGVASGFFPMGQLIASSWKGRGALLEYTSAPTTGGHLTVEFMPIPMINGALGGQTFIPAGSTGGAGFQVSNFSNDGYWKIDNQSGTLTDGLYSLALTGEGFSMPNGLTEVTMVKRVGTGNWFCPGTHLAPTGTASVPTLSRSGITGFSNFGYAGGPNNPLPVTLLSFEATCTAGEITATWTTASETNNRMFLIEQSNDVAQWSTVDTLSGSGNSNSLLSYTSRFTSSGTGISYLRIVQVDFNGTTKAFEPIAVTCAETNANEVIIYPNAVSDIANIELRAAEPLDVQLHVYSSTGQLLRSVDCMLKSGSNFTRLDVSDLGSGIYLVVLANSKQVEFSGSRYLVKQ